MNKVQEIGMITGAVCGGLSVMTLGVVATLNNDNKQLPDVGFAGLSRNLCNLVILQLKFI